MTKVIYYTTKAGENPVDEFLDTLSDQQQRKLIRILVNIESYGLITVIPHIKKLSGIPLWEIRILGRDNIRVLYVSVTNNDVLLLHGFIKKVQKTPISDINIALKRFKDYLERKTRP